MDYFIELLFSGLTRGSIYALIALGYTMVYGIIGLINFAHGEIYMIGAFTAFVVATVLSIYGLPLLAIVVLAGVAATVWAGAYGYTMASNYNARPMCPEVLVDGDKFTVIRKRQTYDNVVELEK